MPLQIQCKLDAQIFTSVKHGKDSVKRLKIYTLKEKLCLKTTQVGLKMDKLSDSVGLNVCSTHWTVGFFFVFFLND